MTRTLLSKAGRQGVSFEDLELLLEGSAEGDEGWGAAGAGGGGSGEEEEEAPLAAALALMSPTAAVGAGAAALVLPSTLFITVKGGGSSVCNGLYQMSGTSDGVGQYEKVSHATSSPRHAMSH